MRSRITVGHLLIRLGRFVESLAVAWMRPSDLVEFNRRHAYAPDRNDSFTRSEATDRNLTKEEIVLLQKLHSANARIILFGDGREELALARKGHDVTLVSEDLCLASAIGTEISVFKMVTPSGREWNSATRSLFGVSLKMKSRWLGLRSFFFSCRQLRFMAA